MKGIYGAVIADLDAQMARLTTVRAGLVALLDGALPVTAVAAGLMRRAKKKGRAKAGAGDDVILEVIRDGADTMNAIIAASKVKRHIANQAVRRLVAAKKVSKTGATKTLRYVAR